MRTFWTAFTNCAIRGPKIIVPTSTPRRTTARQMRSTYSPGFGRFSPFAILPKLSTFFTTTSSTPVFTSAFSCLVSHTERESILQSALFLAKEQMREYPILFAKWDSILLFRCSFCPHLSLARPKLGNFATGKRSWLLTRIFCVTQ